MLDGHNIGFPSNWLHFDIQVARSRKSTLVPVIRQVREVQSPKKILRGVVDCLMAVEILSVTGTGLYN